MVLQTAKGYAEVQLLGACDVALFYKTADWLRQKMGITFTNKAEYAGSIDWQFQFAGAALLLRYLLPTGIFLCPAAGAQATDQEKAGFKKFIETLQSE
ncbi:hypothetical protein [Niastella populi]|uniref:Uncharacterized protein n=1 Tax=Niastella populi TaxID=550983 RepID=A0A1V9GBC0_9BACT|nr:hypothetical protein [Niastella populi]OQP67852.1 hypothetical protein A4R26_10115 [Niastella populi]